MQQSQQSREKRMSAAERRFLGLMSRINRARYYEGLQLTKEQQCEIAHTVHEVQQYGFRFFPNHYIFDKVDRLEKFLKL